MRESAVSLADQRECLVAASSCFRTVTEHRSKTGRWLETQPSDRAEKPEVSGEHGMNTTRRFAM